MLDWLATERPFDVVNLPYTLLIGLAAPLRRDARGADLLHAAGRGPVPGRPRRAVSAAGARPDSRGQRARRRVSSGQRLLRRLHARVSRSSRGTRCAPSRSASTSTATPPGREATRRGLHGRLLRPDRAGERPARAGRSLPAVARAAGHRADRGSWWRATCRPSISRTSTAVRARMAGWGLADDFEYRGELDRDRQDCLPSGPGRHVGARDLRGAEGHVPARGDGQRRAGRAAEARRVPGDRRTDRRRADRRRRRRGGAGRGPARPSGAIPTRAAALGDAGAAGVREHYSVGRMAEEVEAVYRSVIAT